MPHGEFEVRFILVEQSTWSAQNQNNISRWCGINFQNSCYLSGVFTAVCWRAWTHNNRHSRGMFWHHRRREYNGASTRLTSDPREVHTGTYRQQMDVYSYYICRRSPWSPFSAIQCMYPLCNWRRLAVRSNDSMWTHVVRRPHQK